MPAKGKQAMREEAKVRVAKRLEALMLLRGMSVSTLARASGLPTATVHAIATGIGVPGIVPLWHLSGALKCKVSDIVGSSSS